MEVQTYWKRKLLKKSILNNITNFERVNSLFRVALFVALIIIVLAGTFSCRTVREIPTETIRPLSAEKILRRVEKNSFDYQYLTINRINCHFSNSSVSTNFRVNLKALKDEAILISISKINIPVGRVLLTPDSVKYVNYIDRNFFVGGYTFLSRFLNVYIDFHTFQSVLSNSVLNFYNYHGNSGPDSFKSSVENGMYVLSSGYGTEIKEAEKFMNSSFNDSYNLNKIFIDPSEFSLIKLIVSSFQGNNRLEIDFDEFVELEKKEYPASINMSMKSDTEDVELKIRMSGFSTEPVDDIKLNIPGQYDQIF